MHPLDLHTLASFALTTSDLSTSRATLLAHARATAAHLLTNLPPQSLALIRGPSGSGKSTLLEVCATICATPRATGSSLPVCLPPSGPEGRQCIAVGGVGVSPRIAPSQSQFPLSASEPWKGDSGGVHSPQQHTFTLSPLPPHTQHLSPIRLLARTQADIPRALRTLASAGLAEAALLARPARTLSTGQRARLALALLMHHVERTLEHDPRAHALLILDEFASSLDDLTAHTLAITLSRWLQRTPRTRALLATHHTHLAPALTPALTITLSNSPVPLITEPSNCQVPSVQPASAPCLCLPSPPEGRTTVAGGAAQLGKAERSQPPEVRPSSLSRPSEGEPPPEHQLHQPPSRSTSLISPSVPSVDRLLITEGTRRDLIALSHLHYRAALPATILRILVARAPDDDPSAPPRAVLCISSPTLNARWRSLAWPDLFASPDPRTRAKLLNEHVRCISRVIVAPEHRSTGLATALIRHYLADPLTPRTEAIAHMARICPIFSRAGMREHILPLAPRDLALARTLADLDIPPESLADSAHAERLLSTIPALSRALARWASASRATRTLDTPHLLRAATSALLSPPHAYTHEQPATKPRSDEATK